ncbi:MAG: hypothetical protein KatS3mg129_2372 [Leptospiraceae bacterium]|nr:MAG: hypothetical protein KatS3mg129_2372 [Leptospiraceae bacterium]
MKKIIINIILLSWCIFMGMTGISMGFGALFPKINFFVEPILCPEGIMEFKRTVINPLPGTTYVNAFWFCKYASNNITPISNFKIALYAGTIHGILLYFIIIISFKILKKLFQYKYR